MLTLKVRHKLAGIKTGKNNAYLLVFGFFALIFGAGCSQSPSPNIGELVKTGPVLFNGVTDIKLTTPTTSYLLQGTCDPIAYGLQYSLKNQNNWVDVAGGCPANGQFTLNETVTGTLNIYARERTKNGFTSVSHAFVRLLLPPTSPAYTFVVSSNTDQEGGRGTQNSINYNFTAYDMDNGTNKLFLGTVGIVYGK